MAVLAFFVGIALTLLMLERGRFIYVQWAVFFAWVIPFTWMARHCQNNATASPVAPDKIPWSVTTGLLLSLCVFLLSGSTLHKWFYFLDWSPETTPELLPHQYGITRLSVIMSVCLAVILLVRLRPAILQAFLLVSFQIIAVGMFYSVTGGAALYRDDHPSFIFRLWEFGKTFPRLMNYNPYWNGGLAEFVNVSSGVIGVGIVNWPFLRFGDIFACYTPILSILYIFIVPMIAVASLRIIGARWTAAWTAGILALGVSRYFFLWALHFGTIGAIFSTSFILPFSACMFRIVWMRKREGTLIAATVISACFLALWPPGAIMGAVVALGLLTSTRRWTLRSLMIVSLCGVITLVILLPIVLLFVRTPDLIGYTSTAPHAAVFQPLQQHISAGGNRLLATLHEGNPLLLFLGVLGIWFLPLRSVRLWMIPSVIALAFLAGWGPEIRPRLQLERMAIPMFMVAVVPASIYCGRILESRGIRTALVRSFILALLVLGGWNVSQIYANRSHASFVIPGADVHFLANWARVHVPENGRLLFAGKTVHTLGGGHVAPLPIMTGREMMACDYYHFPTDSIEYNYPPRSHRETPEKCFQFMETYNVTHIVTKHDEWRNLLASQPSRYSLSTTNGPWSIFQVLRTPAIFVKGTGSLSADFNTIRISNASAVDGEIIVKYNWVDGLRVTPPAELFPFSAPGDVRIIGIRPNNSSTIEIRY